jgi:uncharacterized peroxidase-related enzyme
MTRIHTPESIEVFARSVPPTARGGEEDARIRPESLFRVVGNSPAALEGYLGLNGALGRGKLDAKTRERVALAVAQANGCDYCLAAHTYLGKNVAKLDDAEIAKNRAGGSSDAKADAAVRFAVRVVSQRGHVGDDDVRSVREAGYSEAEIVELVLHVALNTLTNYVNNVATTVVDFPATSPARAA